MIRKTLLSLAALSALTACQSPAQFEQKPPTWTAVYQAHWQAMANCIVARSQGPLQTVTPTFSAGRANVVVTTPTGSVTGSFDIRQIQGNATEVAYRSVFGGPTSDAGGGARDIADRCARP